MTKPLVMVTADVKSIDGFNWHAVISSYLQAVLKGSDAIPMILPSLGADLDLDSALDQVDGVLATGSRSNVNPQLYGQVPTEENGPYDPDRDATTLPLLKRAVERGIPVFAICRGMQELNVALGGTLLTEIQALAGRNDHRAPTSEKQDERFRIAHPVEISAGGSLEAALGSEPFEVNSLHRQAVGDLGNGLVIEAQAEDGTIEAISVKDSPGFVLATQWHPEWWVMTDGPSKKLFAAFGQAIRDYRQKRLGL
ncbi:MAG: gamma-glutamyl-gamma-aminobutyrate hydrolase family protein [Roseibium sp.]|uniref:gamma-glutamyl-gamma-aminobutyrate hydrolase family protein n=1 Tax=Roseibium sp. TaxID=1936156 RepID=UPI001B1CC623|nr:gamma-glutamyl-gamma-aminobutyrate hydrolase family protein [Roseibium sp.]MBO6895064.1 gamma-glutamyl-gamma-aminobutyrate hydrolase family protein [Roseibium sp.]MBO6932441.1 gamma-glutamyl-gamma-aminobutyrate hydrolase family protein [Roseibium sp.]